MARCPLPGCTSAVASDPQGQNPRSLSYRRWIRLCARSRDHPSLSQRLCVLLIRYGGPEGRAAVIEFLERYGKIFRRPDLDLLQSARLLRQGYAPIWYAGQAARLK